MKVAKGYAIHKCAAGNRRHVPVITGDVDFDHAIAKCKNKDVPARLKEFVGAGNSYGTRTGYNSYTGPSYRGDD